MSEGVSDNYFFLDNTEIQGKRIKYEGRYIFIQDLLRVYA